MAAAPRGDSLRPQGSTAGASRRGRSVSPARCFKVFVQLAHFLACEVETSCTYRAALPMQLGMDALSHLPGGLHYGLRTAGCVAQLSSCNCSWQCTLVLLIWQSHCSHTAGHDAAAAAAAACSLAVSAAACMQCSRLQV